MAGQVPGSLGERVGTTLPSTRRAYEAIAHELLVLILSGRYAPGERLPSERSLAAHYGVSRPTLREALGALESRGLIRTKVGSGTYVNDREAALDDGGDVAFDASPAEVMETRLLVEIGVARIAARRAALAPDGVEQLRAAVEALERAANPEVFPDELDAGFHRALVALSGNDYLDGLLSPIWEAMRQGLFVTMQNVSWTAADTVRIAAEHRAIFESVRIGDAELAAFTMERHLRAAMAKLFSDDADDAPPPRYFA
jgi:DNA-binding FadR family transcriptional regulator